MFHRSLSRNQQDDKITKIEKFPTILSMIAAATQLELYSSGPLSWHVVVPKNTPFLRAEC